MIEVMHQVRKDNFKDYPALVEELDLIEEDDQFTHITTLDDKLDGQEILSKCENNIFLMVNSSVLVY